MTTHDPLCPVAMFGDRHPKTSAWCHCDLIARVRADERSKTPVVYESRLDEAEIRADERERIAEGMKAEAEDFRRAIQKKERERIADLLQMKFSMTSARDHGECVCHLCAINSTVDAAVDWLRGGDDA